MRLIDADELLNSLGCSDLDIEIAHIVDDQPVAYDVDKVVEQLEELPRYSTWNHSSDNVSREKAIEIVKGGGIYE